MLRAGNPYSNQNAYKANEISTVSQTRLIVMLYEGAMRFLKIAGENMTPRKYDLVNNNIIKAQDIITELMLSLNLEDGKEVGNNLLSIYVYMKKRLLEANMKKETKIINEVIDLLGQLKSAWDELDRKDVSEKSSSPARNTGISITG
ncbi:flagellar export chaperone FliS [Leptospira sp. GIMC2001]|uniref:flagellar export chaperone FliS n=1 Tax=Leptospira sp. GIMC2001 TaxID=1513297 RepID=UPI0004A5C478|nr:flagellar export chaperone FliS [Leptospira sp. GIMC2001]AID56252.1 flagellar biosynthesis protein FliS [Leptospira sp. GIMC2001]WCL50937.1 flagellar export chaperone FliS [Leptospira sp. GIMC2001]